MGSNARNAMHIGATKGKSHAAFQILAIPTEPILHGLRARPLESPVGDDPRKNLALVQMDMHIDQSGPEVIPVEIDRVRAAFFCRGHCRDPSVPDEYIEQRNTFRIDGAVGT